MFLHGRNFYNVRVYILLLIFVIIYEMYLVGSLINVFKDHHPNLLLTFYLSDTKSEKKEILTDRLPK